MIVPNPKIAAVFSQSEVESVYRRVLAEMMDSDPEAADIDREELASMSPRDIEREVYAIEGGGLDRIAKLLSQMASA